MTPPLTIRLRSNSDTAAEIELQCPDGSLAAEWGGVLHGPACAYARTLPNDFRIADGRAVIPEPCYWSPHLPFLYDVTLHGKDAGGELHEVKQSIGFRRLAIRRQSLYWDSRRVVLRGMRVKTLTAELTSAAHLAGASLILTNPVEPLCELGDRFGVSLIADLRDAEFQIGELQRIASHCSVAMALVDVDDLHPCEIERVPEGSITAAVVYNDGVQHAPEWCRAVVVELDAGERPPAWIANCGRPAIAIRRGGAYADIHAARAACDRLQAELAPEFDFAGYFVDA